MAYIRVRSLDARFLDSFSFRFRGTDLTLISLFSHTNPGWRWKISPACNPLLQMHAATRSWWVSTRVLTIQSAVLVDP